MEWDSGEMKSQQVTDCCPSGCTHELSLHVLSWEQVVLPPTQKEQVATFAPRAIPFRFQNVDVFWSGVRIDLQDSRAKSVLSHMKKTSPAATTN